MVPGLRQNPYEWSGPRVCKHHNTNTNHSTNTYRSHRPGFHLDLICVRLNQKALGFKAKTHAYDPVMCLAHGTLFQMMLPLFGIVLVNAIPYLARWILNEVTSLSVPRACPVLYVLPPML